MKKFFSLVSIIALAVTAVSFVSCSKDDDDPVNDVDPTPQEEPYRAVQFWASNDLLEIADVTFSGVISNYSFTETKTVLQEYGEGKAGAAFEVTNIKPTDEVNIIFKLKSNWKEIIGDRTKLTLMSGRTFNIYAKGQTFVYPTNPKSAAYRGSANLDIKWLEDYSTIYVGGLEEGLKSVLDMCSIYLTGEAFLPIF